MTSYSIVKAHSGVAPGGFSDSLDNAHFKTVINNDTQIAAIAANVSCTRILRKGNVVTIVMATDNLLQATTDAIDARVNTLMGVTSNFSISDKTSTLLNNLLASRAPVQDDDSSFGYSFRSTWSYAGVHYTCADSTPGAAVWETDDEQINGNAHVAAAWSHSTDAGYHPQIDNASNAADKLLSSSEIVTRLASHEHTASKITDFGTQVDILIAAQSGVTVCDLVNGKVPTARLDLSGDNYIGAWNADTNTPTLADGTGTKGDRYTVSVASTNPANLTLNGTSEWKVRDMVVYNGTVWEKIDNTADVTAVNGLLGDVTLTTNLVAEGGGVMYHTVARVTAHADVAAAKDHVENHPELHRVIDDAGAAAIDKLYSSSKTATLVTDMGATKAALSHGHAAADITSGTMADTRIKATNVTQHVGAIDHNALLNYSANKHIDHSAVSMNTSATSGLDGGGDTTTSRDLVLSVSRLTETTVSDGSTQYLAVHTAAGMRKILVDNLAAGVYGTQFQRVDQLAADSPTQDNNTSYLELLTLVTPSGMPAGDYEVSVSYEISADSIMRSVGVQLQLDEGTVLLSPYNRKAGEGQFYLEHGTSRITLTAGTHHFDLDYKCEAGAGTGIGLRNASISMIRVA